jgi:hypothetical protein
MIVPSAAVQNSAGEFRREGAEDCELTVGRRCLRTHLDHPLICLGERPPHHHQGGADDHRGPFDAGMAVDQYLVALLDNIGHGRGGPL